jgi:ubiquinone/menaquinone biosynthesis C-methylase UbiE
MINKVLVKQYYRDDEVVNTYLARRFSTPLAQVQHENQVNLVNEVIKKYSVINALELAPGPLRVTLDIVGLQRGYAIDYSETMLQVAVQRLREHRPRVQWVFQRGDAFCLPYKADSFDLIFSFRFIRHFQADERERIFSEIRRVLKPNGLLIFEAPNYFTETKIRTRLNPSQLKVYDQLWKKEEVVDELDKNGFNILKMDNNIGHFDIQVNISRFHRLKLAALARRLIRGLDRCPSEQPYEWIVLCQKR